MIQTKAARTVYATATRRAILDLLKHEQRYLTAAAIYGKLRPSIPKLALSTVYRTLDLLTELGRYVYADPLPEIRAPRRGSTRRK